MGRVALVVSVALALLFAVAGPSSAFQCPKLIKQVNDEAGNRLDDAGYNARQLADAPDRFLVEDGWSAPV